MSLHIFSLLQRLKSSWWIVGIVIVAIIAAVFRLDRLGVVPSGMTWDEAAIGYNGHAIVTTRRDEWLIKLPVSFRSFGDYKAPLAIYLSGISTTIFGMDVWSVRLPFALLGVSSVVGMIWLIHHLVRTFFPDVSSNESRLSSLVGGLLLATSVWHIHFSRVGFESGLALQFLIWGMVGILWTLRGSFAKSWQQPVILSISGLSFVLSLYAYHSAKIVVPLVVILVGALWMRNWKQLWRSVGISLIVSLGAVYPLLQDTLMGKGAERFSQTTIFSAQSSFLEQLLTMISNALVHLSPAFLLFGQTTTLRHGDGQWGVLLLTEAILLLIGLWSLFRTQATAGKSLSRLRVFVIGWIIIGLLPAAIGTEVPHANRVLLILPILIFVQVLGLRSLWKKIATVTSARHVFSIRLSVDDQRNIYRATLGMIVLLHVLSVLSYRHHYFTVYAKSSADAFSYGYIEAMQYASSLEDSVDKILFTSRYGQPYIYALFVRQTNPIWYQGGSLIKYEFSDQISVKDLARNNTLIVASPEEIDPSEADQLIIAPDGAVRFVIVDPVVQQ